MKEPGQIAYEAWHHQLFGHPGDWSIITMKQRWAAVEAACRAEGMREAARIVDKWVQPGEPGTEEWLARGNMLGQVAQAILSAIGDSQ